MPPQRSTTGCPSTYTHTAAPISPRSSKFAVNASNTGSNSVATQPLIVTAAYPMPMGRLPAAAQCEPVDLEPIDVTPRAPLPPPRPIPRRVWIAVGLATVVIWGAIAFATRNASHDTTPRAPIDALSEGIVDLGRGRFAAVVDNQLYVIERDRPGLHATVPLPAGPITVTGQSGDSLAVQTSNGNAIAFTTPIHSELVPVDRPVIADTVPGRWWTQHKDNI